MNAADKTLFRKMVYTMFSNGDSEELHKIGGSTNCELTSKFVPDLLNCRMPPLHALRVKQ